MAHKSATPALALDTEGRLLRRQSVLLKNHLRIQSQR